jgi:hypothetical protein
LRYKRLMQATRFETVIEIDPKLVEFKGTPSIVVAVGAIGRTDPKPAIEAKGDMPAQVAQDGKLIWAAEIPAISIRRATDARQVKAELANVLRKIASAIDAEEI